MYSQALEDYLEVIYDIAHRKGHARTKDISMELEISPPSVTEMLKKLSEMDLVNYERYSGVTLTKEGERIAKSVKNRHKTIKKLLTLIQVSDETAGRDACKIEHEISPETVERLTKLLKFIESESKHFKKFCENETN